jgi:alpha-tubulin suppressor-like RCC1 family protein
VKNLLRSRRTPSRSLAIFVPVVALSILSCKKDALAPDAAARQLAFTVQPSTTIVDSSIAPAIAVTVEDGSGNIVTASNAIVTLTLNATASAAGVNLVGTGQVVAIAGIATFPYLSLNLPGSGYTLTASVTTGLTSATSAPFSVTSQTIGSFSSINTGGNATCGITTASVGYCWGNNSLGQLGNAATTNSTTPIKIFGGLTFSSISVGGLQGFTCGLTTAGAAYCWGYNDYGQLGTGNFTNTIVPVPVTGKLTFTALSAGESGQACALVAGGAAYCWGYNGSGQLGNGSVAYSSSPLPVSGGLSFASISAGENGQTCGVTLGGAGYCWGYNVDGELGNGTGINSPTPVAVSGGFSFKSISAGFMSTCGVTTSGAAVCWGDNTYGELGNGSTANSKVPAAVSGGLTFAAVSVGDAFACGLTTSGAAYCWGYANQGQLGTGTAARSSTPVAVAGGIIFASINAGYASACAVTPGGAAYCWGDNAFGEIGNQSIVAALRPALVVTPPSP